MGESDDWVEKILYAERIAPVADDGFADRFMASLPVRRRMTPHWPILMGATIGAALAAIVLENESVGLAMYRLIALHDFQIVALLPFMLIWAGCAWALSESQ